MLQASYAFFWYILSLPAAIIALVAIATIVLWLMLGYLGLRMMVVFVDPSISIFVRYTWLTFGPISFLASTVIIILALAYIELTEFIWEDLILVWLKNFHRHIKSMR